MENILSEYDKSPGIISPDFEKMDLHLPKRAVFAFLGEKRIERFVLARGGEKAGTFVSLTKDFPLWMIKADKEKLCIPELPPFPHHTHRAVPEAGLPPKLPPVPEGCRVFPYPL